MSGLITRDETTALKGIAILMVIVEHIGQAFNIGVVNPLGPIGVFLFLFLSGYGLTCSYQSNGRKGYFKRKILKVYLPYVMAVILFLVWSAIIGTQNDLSTVLQYFVLLKLPQGSYWYLILLFYWYVVFYILTFVFDKDRALIPLMLIASLGIIWLEGFSRLYVWQFASFPLGILTAKYPEKAKKILVSNKPQILRGGYC